MALDIFTFAKIRKKNVSIVKFSKYFFEGVAIEGITYAVTTISENIRRGKADATGEAERGGEGFGTQFRCRQRLTTGIGARVGEASIFN